jgi:hypothetical protein
VITLDVEYLTYDEIAKKAEAFLDQNNVTSIPVPIEEIIDQNYNINIIPIPGLLDICGVDGLSDCSSISIDEFIYKNRYYRFRFTLAHEIAHFILHREYLSKCTFTSITRWKEVYDEIDISDHSKMEYQGYAFSGLVLVPRRQLINYVKNYLPQITQSVQEAQKKGIKRDRYLSYAKDELASILSPLFEVSIDVLTRRFDFDKLEYLIP